MGDMIEGVVLTPLKIFSDANGEVLHGMKINEKGYMGFGEAYFSTIQQGHIKAWKLHNKMTLNIMVPEGEIRFIIYDERSDTVSMPMFQEIVLSKENNYQRLTIPPGVWVGFQGVSNNLNLLLNIADIPHDPDEVERRDENYYEYDWGRKQ